MDRLMSCGVCRYRGYDFIDARDLAGVSTDAPDFADAAEVERARSLDRCTRIYSSKAEARYYRSF